MKRIILPLFVYSSTASATDIEYRIQADVWSEPVAVHDFLNDWHGPLQSGKNAFAHGKVYVLAQEGAWQFGWVYSYDYALNFSQDMAKLYYQMESDHPIDTNAQYDLFLEANHIESIAARFAHVWPVNQNWKLTTGVSAVRGMHYVNGEFSGQGQTGQATQVLDQVQWLNASLDYSYDRPTLKEDELGLGDLRAKHGYGYAFDFRIQGQPHPFWSIDLNIEDALSHIYWEQAPFSRYQLSYDQEQRPRMNLDGSVSTRKQYKQTLPYKIRSEIEFSPNTPWGVGVTSFTNPFTSLWQMNAYWHQPKITWGIHVEPQTKAYGLSAEHRYFGLSYMTDQLETNQAHRFLSKIYAHYTW